MVDSTDSSQVLRFEERVNTALLLGESHFREFKSALEGSPGNKRRRPVNRVARDIGETLVSFANADGGQLLIGVEDDGTVSGLPYGEGELSVLRKAPESHIHRDTPLATPVTRVVPLGDQSVLYFAVAKGSRYVHLTSDGRCVQRKDRETVPVSSENVRFDRKEQVSREYDREFVERARVTDLDIDLVNQVAEAIAPGMSPEKCLQNLGLAEFGNDALAIRRAALLLFAKDSRSWFPRSEVRVFRVAGTEVKAGREHNIEQEDVVSGNIFELLSRGWDQLRQYLVQRRLISGTGTFQPQVVYPEDACREALINAIAHRDYHIEGRGIEVFVYNDRLEVLSPGRLLSTLSLADLQRPSGAHDSRNASVARTLRELGYMREMGEGMRRIHALVNEYEQEPPNIESSGDSFVITFSQRNVFSSEEQRWLDAFSEFDLTREEKLVVLLSRGGQLVSTHQIWQALDLVDTEDYRRITEGLRIKGLLSSTVASGSATAQARRQGIPRREIPRFSIRSPSIALRDQQEVIQAVVSLEVQGQITSRILAGVAGGLSDQNCYKGSAARIRQLALLKGLIDSNGSPTEEMANLRSAIARGAVRSESPGEGASDTLSLAPVQDIYVGNLSYSASESSIRSLFAPLGEVVRVVLPKDYLTGQGRGYAFVSMGNMRDARNAVAQLDGQEFYGRHLKLGWSFRRNDT